MGMSIYGKISTGMVTTADPPRIAIRMAMTTNVYGRPNASRTIHILVQPRDTDVRENRKAYTCSIQDESLGRSQCWSWLSGQLPACWKSAAVVQSRRPGLLSKGNQRAQGRRWFASDRLRLSLAFAFTSITSLSRFAYLHCKRRK